MPRFVPKVSDRSPSLWGDIITVVIVAGLTVILVWYLIKYHLDTRTKSLAPVTSSIPAADLTMAPDDAFTRGNDKD